MDRIRARDMDRFWVANIRMKYAHIRKIDTILKKKLKSSVIPKITEGDSDSG